MNNPVEIEFLVEKLKISTIKSEGKRRRAIYLTINHARGDFRISNDKGKEEFIFRNASVSQDVAGLIVEACKFAQIRIDEYKEVSRKSNVSITLSDDGEFEILELKDSEE